MCVGASSDWEAMFRRRDKYGSGGVASVFVCGRGTDVLVWEGIPAQDKQIIFSGKSHSIFGLLLFLLFLHLTSLEESDLIWEEFEAYLASDSFPPGSDDTDFDLEGDLCLIEELLNNDPSSPLSLSHNPLSGSTTSSSPNHLLEEFADELALITFPPGNDDLPFDIEYDLIEIEYFLNHDPTKKMDSILEDSVDEGNLADPNNDLVDTIPEMFTDEHTLDYSSPPLYDDVDDDLVELESDNDNVYDDPFDSRIAPDFEASRAYGFVLRLLELQILSFILGIQYLNLID
ncbi:hypothetical protein Tco_0680058 [Tanacetum coccineum]|uniref:Reverse transcriptase domain-containing protein n=1 Tax=Tanacetum coccineum TaxID=301880 RepID=A0ABQ4XJH9_9ASTR